MVRLRITTIEKGDSITDLPSAEIVDLEEGNTLMMLVYQVANGEIAEMRVEAENQEGLEAIRGLMIGTGNANLADSNLEEVRSARLFLEDAECFRQPMNSPNFIFIRRTPQPELFPEILPPTVSDSPPSPGTFSHMDYK